MRLTNTLGMGGLALLLNTGCRSEAPVDQDAYGSVVITPEYPGSREDLSCFVDNSAADYDFFWFVNEEGVYREVNDFSTLSQKYTAMGDDVLCSVWTPSSAEYDAFEVGSATVYIGGEE